MREKKQQAFLRNWKKTRKQGRTKYILIQAPLWALVTYILYNGLRLIFSRDYLPADFLLDVQTGAWWIKFLVLLIVFGPIYGVLSWHMSERSYKKLLDEMKQNKEFMKELKS